MNRFRLFLAVITAVNVSLIAAKPVFAGDLYAADAKHDWSGPYLGLTINGNGTGVDVSGVGESGKADLKSSAFTASAIAGYNFTGGPFVFGFEADIGNLGFNDTQALAGLGNVTAKSDWNAAAALRAGYAFDNLLLFAKGGAAFTNLDISSSLGGESKGTRIGAVVGVGADYAINNTWSVRGELDVYGYRSDATLAGAKRDFDLAEGVARLGFTAKF